MRAAAAIHATDSRTMHHAARSRIGDASDHTLPFHSFGEVPIHRKASCTCGGACPACQAKSADLHVSQPSDAAEIEADRIADRIMRMSAGDAKPQTKSSNPSNQIHRKCDACEEEEDDVGENPVMRKEAFASAAPTPPPDTLPSIRNVISSGGSPLDRTTRSFFEPRFGADLGHVRIHTDSTAGQSARAINAKAYTLGSNIVFGNRQYQPEAETGKRLLAHELAHVTQYGASSNINRQTIYRQPVTDPSLAVSRVENEDGTWSALNSRGEVIDTGSLGPVINPSLPNLYETVVVGERVKADSQTKGTGVSSSCPTQYTEISIGAGDATTPITRRPEYIDNAMDKMLYGIYLGGFVLYMKGTDETVFVSNRFLVDRENSRSVGDCIYGTVQEAQAGVAAYTRPDDKTPRHAYYWGGGGKYIVPDVISIATTPRIMATLFEARKELANQVQRDLTGVATGMIISKGLSYGYSKARTSFTSDPLPPKNITPPTQNPPAPPPDLRVIQGGKGAGYAPPVNTPAVNTGTSTSTPYFGRGGAAPAMSLDAAPVPAQVPRPGPVGVPGWNPNPVPVSSAPAPVGPVWKPTPVPVASSPAPSNAPTASAFMFGASALGLNPIPRPDVDRDLDKEQKRGKCKYLSVGQQFGRFLCHAQYATSLSQVPREMRITDPNGISVDYDAMDFGGSLYEVKTGYRWLVFMGDPVRVNDIAARFWTQAAEQMLVAEECGHSLTWYFNDPYVASFFGAENAPYPEYFQAPLLVRVRYEPFDCNVDSDG